VKLTQFSFPLGLGYVSQRGGTLNNITTSNYFRPKGKIGRVNGWGRKKKERGGGLREKKSQKQQRGGV